MALQKVEVNKYPDKRFYNIAARPCIEMIQTYSRNDVEIPSRTYSIRYFYNSHHEVGLNIIRQPFIDGAKKDLLSDALDLVAQGFQVSGFAVRAGYNGRFYEVDSLDIKHMQLLSDINNLVPPKKNLSISPEF